MQTRQIRDLQLSCGWLYFEPPPPTCAAKIGLWHWNHQVFLASTIVPGDDLLVGLQICHLYGFKNQIQNFIGTGRATTQSLGRPSLSIPTLVSLNALFCCFSVLEEVFEKALLTMNPFLERNPQRPYLPGLLE